MADQMIFRTIKDKNNPYVIMNKTGLEDKRLSWKAKGILGYLLGQPDDWQIRMSHLVKQSTDGELSLKKGIQELKKYGYVVRVAVRSDGKIDRWETWVNEIPLSTPIPGFIHISCEKLECFRKEGRLFYIHTEQESYIDPCLLENIEVKKNLNKSLLVDFRPEEKTQETSLLGDFQLEENQLVGNQLVGNQDLLNNKLLSNKLLSIKQQQHPELMEKDLTPLDTQEERRVVTLFKEQKEKDVVVVKNEIKRLLEEDFSDKQILNLCKLSKDNKKDLIDCINYSVMVIKIFKEEGEPIESVYGVLNHEITIGWKDLESVRKWLRRKKGSSKRSEKPNKKDEEKSVLDGYYPPIEGKEFENRKVEFEIKLNKLRGKNVNL